MNRYSDLRHGTGPSDRRRAGASRTGSRAAVLILLSATAALLAGASTASTTEPGASREAWASSSAGSAPGEGALALPGTCLDRAESSRRTEALFGAVEAMAQGLDGGPESARRVAVEAVAGLRELPEENQQALCRTLERSGTSVESLDELTRDLRSARSPSGCIGLQTYRAILGVETVFLALQAAAQGFCDASSCYNPLTGPPRCQFVCVVPGAFANAVEIIATRRDISDKCADETHEDLMDDARASSRSLLDGILEGIGSAVDASNETAQGSATEEELSQTAETAAAGFDGASVRGAGGSGIGPRLASLESALAESTELQRRFEAEALEARIEAVIIDQLAVNRLQLPMAQGGLLERLRETVAGRIQSADQVGLPIDVALVAFRTGDAAFNDARFKDAYAAYVSAYQALDPTRSGHGGKR